MDHPTLSPQAAAFPLGTYQHYKGGRYEVLGVGLHSETLEELVVYRAEYGEKLIWIRPFAMFLETVDIDGTPTPRFTHEAGS